MPLPVQLKEVVLQLEIGDDMCRGYINRKTGEVVSVTEEIQRAVEMDDPPDGGWMLEAWQDCKRVLDDADFITLPSQYDIHEYAIMKRFCLAREDAEERDLLLDAIAGRGAFRMFKSIIHRKGIEQDWYRYRDAALKRIAADFLEAQGIPYADDATKP
jgi:hypothetical protein